MQKANKTEPPELDPSEPGESEEHAKCVSTSPTVESEIDEAMGLQLISIRLQKSLIEDFKYIAQVNNGLGYQALMRQCLQRFAEAEKRQLLKDAAFEASKQSEKRRRYG